MIDLLDTREFGLKTCTKISDGDKLWKLIIVAYQIIWGENTLYSYWAVFYL